jgi:hypothetical protein
MVGVAIPAAAAEEPTTLKGEIVELGLYLREGRHGAAVTEAAYEMGTDHATLALLDEEADTLYLIVGKGLGQNPNELAYSYLTQRVLVTGVLYERSGLKGIVVTSIEPVSP